MRVASGEVRRGHTSYDSLRRVTAIPFEVSNTPQDLLRRAADLKCCAAAAAVVAVVAWLKMIRCVTYTFDLLVRLYLCSA